MEHDRDHREGVVHPAVDAEGTRTVYPERDLQPGELKLTGAAPPEEKKGIAGRVKDMMGRRGRRGHKKDATTSAGDTDPAVKGGVLHKVKTIAGRKAGHDQEGTKHGPARLLSMASSSSSMSSSDEEDIGTVGFALDPTGPAVAGSSLGREDFSNAPEGPGADFRDLDVNSDGETIGEETDQQHSEHAAQFAKSSNPINFGEGSNSTLTPSEGDLNHGGSDRSHTSERSNSNLGTPSKDACDGPHDHSHPTENLGNNSNQSASDAAGEPHPSEGQGLVGKHHGLLHGDHNAKQSGIVHKVMNDVR